MLHTPTSRTSTNQTRIDIHEPQELRYWSKVLCVAPQHLRELVHRHGASVKRIKDALRREELIRQVAARPLGF